MFTDVPGYPEVSRTVEPGVPKDLEFLADISVTEAPTLGDDIQPGVDPELYLAGLIANGVDPKPSEGNDTHEVPVVVEGHPEEEPGSTATDGDGVLPPGDGGPPTGGNDEYGEYSEDGSDDEFYNTDEQIEAAERLNEALGRVEIPEPAIVVEERRIGDVTVKVVLADHCDDNLGKIAEKLRGAPCVLIENSGGTPERRSDSLRIFNTYLSSEHDGTQLGLQAAATVEERRNAGNPIAEIVSRLKDGAVKEIDFIDAPEGTAYRDAATRSRVAHLQTRFAVEGTKPIYELRRTAEREVLRYAEETGLRDDLQAGQIEDKAHRPDLQAKHATVAVVCGIGHYGMLEHLGDDATPQKDAALKERVLPRLPSSLLAAEECRRGTIEGVRQQSARSLVAHFVDVYHPGVEVTYEQRWRHANATAKLLSSTQCERLLSEIATRTADAGLSEIQKQRTVQRVLSEFLDHELPNRDPQYDESTIENVDIFTPETAYDTAVQALRNRGEYRGDAHYAYADVKVVTPGGDVPGRVTIKDYHSYESTQFEVRPGGAGSDPEEQARLLETGKAVIGIDLACHTKDPAIRLPFYTLIEPANIRPDLGFGTALEDKGVPPSEWPDGKFVIIRTVEKDTEYLEYDTRIMTNEDINSDPQLVEIMRVLRGMATRDKRGAEQQ